MSISRFFQTKKESLQDFLKLMLFYYRKTHALISEAQPWQLLETEEDRLLILNRYKEILANLIQASF
jgi:hypothetical protein